MKTAWIHLVFGLMLVMPLTGCGHIFGAILSSKSDIRPAVFQLEKMSGDIYRRRILIVVDDDYHLLKQSNAKFMMGAGIQALLIKNETFKNEQFVSQKKLNDLISKLGWTEYNKLSIYGIGKKLDASHIIFVEVHSMTLNSNAGHGIRPVGMTKVRVYDVKEKKRVFPKTHNRSYPVKSQLFYDAKVTTDKRDEVGRNLLARMTRDVARLFYEYDYKTFEN